MFGLCKYKDILGKPKEGIHSIRLFNVAIMDVLFTIIGAYIIHLIVPKFKFWCLLLSIFFLGIILHHVFCVRTTIDKLLFPK